MLKNQGVQCRTMLSQRPCGNAQCTREECAREKLYESVFATVLDTENSSTGSESAPQTTGEGEPLYTLERLSAHDVALIEMALRMLRRTYTRESPWYQEVSDLGARIQAQTD